jgi:hypothetical protein
VVKVSIATRKAVNYWVSQALAELRKAVAGQ